MKLNKTNILEELKGLWNDTKIIGGIKIARVVWHDNPYKVINKNTTFDNVAEREFKPLKTFYSQAELAKYIFENQIIKA